MNSCSFVLDNAKAPMWAIQQIRNCRAGDHFFSITYSAASGACEKGKQWQQSLELFEGMPGEGVQPSTITYSVAIRVCEKGEQWQQTSRITVILCLDYTTSGSFSFVSRPKPLGSLTESRLTTCFRHLNK